MIITPGQAQEWLDNATPGPWTRTMMGALTDAYGEYLVHGPDGNMHDADANLAAAAPDMAETIAGMTEEWGVQHGTTVICLDFYGTEDEESGHIRWTPDRPRAEAWKKTMEDCFPGETYRLVRRPVGSAVVVEGE